MSDLYVNGSSFATGWNEEYQHMSTKTPAPSYAEFLAEQLGATSLYKHCHNGKAPQSSVDQSIEFCDEYRKKYGSTDNLKIVIELTALRYKQWSLIKDKKGEWVQPVSYIKFDDIRDYNHYYIKRHLKEDLNEEVVEVPVYDLPAAEIKKYEDEMNEWFPPGKQFDMINVMKYYNTAVGHFDRLADYFRKHNIDYLVWWVPGKRNPQTRYRRTLDTVSKRYQPNFVSPAHFCGQEIVDDDKTSFRGHPGIAGHKQLAKHIFDYACAHNLLGANHG